MKNNRKVREQIQHQLNIWRSEWLESADRAESFKQMYEEANLFINRAIQRLPEDHPLHPFSYSGFISDEYLADLASAFTEQDTESAFDPEMDEIIGVEDVPLTDEVEKIPVLEEGYPGVKESGFNISDYNKQVIEDANSMKEEK